MKGREEEEEEKEEEEEEESSKRWEEGMYSKRKGSRAFRPSWSEVVVAEAMM